MGRMRKDNPSMTKRTLKKLREDTFKLSQAKMAVELGISVRAYITYETGDQSVPEPIAKLIRCLADKQ